MADRSTEIQLVIEMDSDPIAGTASGRDGEPQLFCGWMELVALLESVRLGVNRATGAALDTKLGGRPGGLIAAAEPWGQS